jgi:hypothetical protein
MKQLHFAATIFIVAGLVSISRSHAETVREFTFSNYVKTERVRACTESPIPSCDGDFDKLVLIAERLDAQEKIAEAFENSGEKEKALEIRRQIIADAVMLDFLLDSLILLHKKRGKLAPSSS